MENEAYSKIVKLCGMEVAEVREQLSDLLIAQDKVQFDINGAFGEVVIRLSSEDENAREKIKSLIRELKVRFGSSIFTSYRCTGSIRSIFSGICDLFRSCQTKDGRGKEVNSEKVYGGQRTDSERNGKRRRIYGRGRCLCQRHRICRTRWRRKRRSGRSCLYWLLCA